MSHSRDHVILVSYSCSTLKLLMCEDAYHVSLRACCCLDALVRLPGEEKSSRYATGQGNKPVSREAQYPYHNVDLPRGNRLKSIEFAEEPHVCQEERSAALSVHPAPKGRS